MYFGKIWSRGRVEHGLLSRAEGGKSGPEAVAIIPARHGLQKRGQRQELSELTRTNRWAGGNREEGLRRVPRAPAWAEWLVGG